MDKKQPAAGAKYYQARNSAMRRSPKPIQPPTRRVAEAAGRVLVQLGPLKGPQPVDLAVDELLVAQQAGAEGGTAGHVLPGGGDGDGDLLRGGVLVGRVRRFIVGCSPSKNAVPPSYLSVSTMTPLRLGHSGAICVGRRLNSVESIGAISVSIQELVSNT
jgi:hypothetical protein